jgi:signal transduction histidine kinase
MDRTIREVRRPENASSVRRVTYVLQNDNSIFTAELDETTDTSPGRLIPIGSVVNVSGVCVTEIDSDGVLKAFRILAGRSADIRVLQAPAWWTPQRLLMGLAGIFAVLMLAVVWTVMVANKNRMLQVLIREREQAQVELQRAHDELEDRVAERTAQLQFQITARKEAQLQFKAVLRERTRLAQELHDTLEQTLTGIALQMDTAARMMGRDAKDAARHFDLARNLVTRGQTEVRRSVWDLRSRSLEQFNLASALRESSKQLTDGTSTRVEVVAKGRVRPLPETMEDNLLRIALESLTNIMKHSSATAALIELDYGLRNIQLKIADNGKGFSVADCAGPREGHFGLLGITERAKRMGGEATFTSAPGKGTVVRVSIPLDPDRELGSTDESPREIS